MTDRHWVPLDGRVLHDGWIPVIERRYRLPDGRAATWELRAGRDSVGVLPLTAGPTRWAPPNLVWPALDAAGLLGP